MKNLFILFGITIILLLLTACDSSVKKTGSVEIDEDGYAILTDEQIENTDLGG